MGRAVAAAQSEDPSQHILDTGDAPDWVKEVISPSSPPCERIPDQSPP